MKSAIIFSVFTICLVGVYSETEEPKKPVDPTNKCVQSSGVDESILLKINDRIYVKDDKGDCFFACMMQEYGAMDDKGKINEEDPSIGEIGRECIKTVSADLGPCEKAGKITECLMKKELEQMKKAKE